jgi:hypothetical protein
MSDRAGQGIGVPAVEAHDEAPFEHADLHEAIAVVLASGGPVEDELDAATEIMDLLVRRRIIPPPEGYDADLNPTDGRWVCPDCGCRNGGHEAFCYRCGAGPEEVA